MPKPHKLLKLKDFSGKSYIFSHSENYEKFLQELGVKKNTRAHAVNSKPTVVLYFLSDDEYLLDTTYPEGRRVKVKFKVGEEIQRRRSNGCPTTSVFYALNNKLIEEQCSEDRKVTIEREFTKDYLSVMMKVNDVQCYRFYAVKTSDHSVRTETSRRYSLWDVESESEASSTTQTRSATKEELEDDLCI